MQLQARKADTRNKIELGGLTIKAGLDNEDRSTLLGLMLAAKEMLASEKGINARAKWKQRGQAEFDKSK